VNWARTAASGRSLGTGLGLSGCARGLSARGPSALGGRDSAAIPIRPLPLSLEPRPPPRREPCPLRSEPPRLASASYGESEGVARPRTDDCGGWEGPMSRPRPVTPDRRWSRRTRSSSASRSTSSRPRLVPMRPAERSDSSSSRRPPRSPPGRGAEVSRFLTRTRASFEPSPRKPPRPSWSTVTSTSSRRARSRANAACTASSTVLPVVSTERGPVGLRYRSLFILLLPPGGHAATGCCLIVLFIQICCAMPIRFVTVQ
jgi:hypothetical protein